MLFKTSEYVECLMVVEEAVRRQFEVSEQELENEAHGDADPLREKEHEVVPGLINKYGNRVLALLTTECAAYCRFCTRRRLVSDTQRGTVDRSHVDAWMNYLRKHGEVREVILSGGDPFIVEDDLFEYVLSEISGLDSIKVIRIGTRAPVSDPCLVNDRKLEIISRIEQPIYVGIHFEHPAEMTRATVRCIKNLRSAGAILYSQTVFLKGVNDDYQTLFDLFTGLIEIGVRPYYLYQCDPVPGAEHFRVDPEKERHIMTQLRRSLSGLACPNYVIDAPNGSGKIPVPLEFWNCDTTKYTDFEGSIHRNK
ncbi:MAG: KamA family radical SAM protein [Armatimonadota bacterium]|nr:KamA family radical SAM protein [bacterium]